MLSSKKSKYVQKYVESENVQNSRFKFQTLLMYIKLSFCVSLSQEIIIEGSVTDYRYAVSYPNPNKVEERLSNFYETYLDALRFYNEKVEYLDALIPLDASDYPDGRNELLPF